MFAVAVYAVFPGQLQANAYCENPDIVLVGNKADLADQREVQEKQAKELADKYGYVCFPRAEGAEHNVSQLSVQLNRFT